MNQESKPAETQTEAEKELSFDLRREEKKIKITKPDSTVATWTLREIDGSQRVLYMNMMGSKLKTDAEGKSVVKDYSGIETNLVAMCLFDENDKPVPESEIKKFPSKVQGNLYNAAMILCGLMEKKKDEAKND